MTRWILATTCLALVAAPASAQQRRGGETPAAQPMAVHALLKTGGRIEIRKPTKTGEKLCGGILPEGAPRDAVATPGCIAMSEIASYRVTGAQSAVVQSTKRTLCLVSPAACLALIAEASQARADARPRR